MLQKSLVGHRIHSQGISTGVPATLRMAAAMPGNAYAGQLTIWRSSEAPASTARAGFLVWRDSRLANNLTPAGN